MSKSITFELSKKVKSNVAPAPILNTSNKFENKNLIADHYKLHFPNTEFDYSGFRNTFKVREKSLVILKTSNTTSNKFKNKNLIVVYYKLYFPYTEFDCTRFRNTFKVSKKKAWGSRFVSTQSQLRLSILTV